jgi:hypothetical protein
MVPQILIAMLDVADIERKWQITLLHERGSCIRFTWQQENCKVSIAQIRQATRMILTDSDSNRDTVKVCICDGARTVVLLHPYRYVNACEIPKMRLRAICIWLLVGLRF